MSNAAAVRFEDAFEEGNFEEFNAWVASGKKGWLRVRARLVGSLDAEILASGLACP
jgi:hypothetical protein